MNDEKKNLESAGCTEEWIKEKLKSHSPGQVTMMCFYRLANYYFNEIKKELGDK
jgi:hypothetical protein